MRLHWLDELGGESSGIYGLDAHWPVQSLGIGKIVAAAAPLEVAPRAADGSPRWQLVRKNKPLAAPMPMPSEAAQGTWDRVLADSAAGSSAAHASLGEDGAFGENQGFGDWVEDDGSVGAAGQMEEPTSDAAADVEPAVAGEAAEAVDPNDSLAALLRQKVEAKAKEAAMEVRVTEEMRVKMDTGVRVNPALAAHFGDSAPNPAPDREVIDIDLLVEGDKIELKSKRSRRCAFPLSSSDTSASTFLIW